MTASGADSVALNGAFDILRLWAAGPGEVPAVTGVPLPPGGQAAGEPGPQFPGLRARDRGDVAVVRLGGEPEAAGAPAVRAVLDDLRWLGPVRCVVDLTALAFLDFACLGVLVRHCRQVRAQGGSFAVAGPQGAVRTVLAATGLTTWFEVYDTVGEAVPAVPRPRR